MDLSAYIVVIVMMVAFFSFIVWLSIYSRKADSGRLPVEKSGSGGKDE